MAVIGIVDDEVYYMCSVLSIHCLTKWLLVNSFAVMAHMQILMTASSLGTVKRAKYAIAREICHLRGNT